MTVSLKMALDEDYRKRECVKKRKEVNKRLRNAWAILGKMTPKERVEYLQTQ